MDLASPAFPLTEPVPHLVSARWAFVALDASLGPGHLTPGERAIYEDLRTPRRKMEWCGGRMAAHAALQALGWSEPSVLRQESGAPLLVGGQSERYAVALAHDRHRAVAIAGLRTDDRPWLGIDLVAAEDQPRIERAAERWWTDTERRVAEARPEHLRLAWGVREAVAKATETGMFVFALQNVCIEAVDVKKGLLQTNLDGVIAGFEWCPEGHAVVFAGVTEAARARARSAAGL